MVLYLKNETKRALLDLPTELKTKRAVKSEPQESKFFLRFYESKTAYEEYKSTKHEVFTDKYSKKQVRILLDER